MKPEVLKYHEVHAVAAAADAAYSAAIIAAGYRDRWSMPGDAMRKHPEIAAAYAAKVAADRTDSEWFRISFKACHG